MNKLTFLTLSIITLLAAICGFRIVSVQAASITVSPPKFEINAEKGGNIKQEITITNGDQTDLTLTISTADFTASGESGEASFTTGENSTAFSLSTWVSLPQNQITIPADGKYKVPFFIQVPVNAESGGHFGTIFFSPVNPLGGTIAVQQKVGVLILVRVAGDVIEKGDLDSFGTYSASIKADEVAQSQGQAFFEKFPLTFAVRFTNTGNVHIKPQGQIVIKNMLGQELKDVADRTLLTPTGALAGTERANYVPVNDKGGNVLPQSTRVFLSAWPGKGLGFGRYSAELDLRYGTMELPRQIIHFWIIPWKIISLILLVLAGLIWGLRAWRKAARARLKDKLRRELEQEHNSNHYENET